MTRFAALLLLAAVAAVVDIGCVSVPDTVSPPPSATEMDRYFATFRTSIGVACGDAAEQVGNLADDDEMGARKAWGQCLQAAAKASHGEVSATEAALSATGWSNAKFAEILRRRQGECVRGQ